MVGEYLPIVTLSHQYLITEDIPALVERGAARLPLLRDPDVSYYMRQERQGLILGPVRVAGHGALAGQDSGRVREPAVRRRPRPAREIHRSRVRARADPRHGRRQESDQRPDPVRARWQSADRSRAGLARLLPLLRLHVRHRAGGRRRQDHCRMGRARTARVGRVAARFAALPRICERQVRAGQSHRDLPARIRHRLPGRGTSRGSPGQDLTGVPAPRCEGREVRRPRRLGTRRLLPAGQRSDRAGSLVPSSGVAQGDRA